jgi:pimeloyl-ACP methyl ester carboxylesterase
MPLTKRDGLQLYYEVFGDAHAPAVVLQHPLCSEPECFDETTLCARLIERGYRVVRPASLAHGRSSTPVGAEHRYSLPERARDVVHILDELGIERAAYVGYSMGTWIGCGLLAHHPERLVSASLGGFDLVRGAHSCGIPLRLTQSTLGVGLLGLYALWSESRINLRDHDLVALQRCFTELYEPMPTLDTLQESGVPLMLWSARHDFYQPHMTRAAARLGVPCQIYSGHHFSASSDERFVPHILAHITTSSGPDAQL